MTILGPDLGVTSDTRLTTRDLLWNKLHYVQLRSFICVFGSNSGLEKLVIEIWLLGIKVAQTRNYVENDNIEMCSSFHHIPLSVARSSLTSPVGPGKSAPVECFSSDHEYRTWSTTSDSDRDIFTPPSFFLCWKEPRIVDHRSANILYQILSPVSKE